MAQGPAAARPGDESGAGRRGWRAQACLGAHTLPGPQAANSRMGSGCDMWADVPELTAGHWGLEDTVCTRGRGVVLPSPNPAVTLFPQLPLLLPPRHLVMDAIETGLISI